MTADIQSQEEKLQGFMAERGVEGEHLSFEQSCHSVADAAKAASACPEEFVKNICMIDADGRLIVAIVKGEHNASSSRVAKALRIERPRTAQPEEILERTGYPCGGTPSFGYEAIFLVDPKVMECPIVYTGGGSVQSLVRVSPQELVRSNAAEIVRIRR